MPRTMNSFERRIGLLLVIVVLLSVAPEPRRVDHTMNVHPEPPKAPAIYKTAPYTGPSQGCPEKPGAAIFIPNQVELCV